jgi:hypothetical protein
MADASAGVLDEATKQEEPVEAVAAASSAAGKKKKKKGKKKKKKGPKAPEEKEAENEAEKGEVGFFRAGRGETLAAGSARDPPRPILI